MVIKTIKSNKLRLIWEHDDITVLPVSYGFSVRDTLLDIDSASCIGDMEDVGAVQFHPDHKEAWSVTITVNNVEPCAAIVCDFWQGDCYNVDLREYNA